jgi:type II secretory pathway component PulF
MFNGYHIIVADLIFGNVGVSTTSYQFDLTELLAWLSYLAGILLLGALALAFVFSAGYAVYFLFSLPRRRLERAMVFLNLVDAGIRRGVPPEDTIRSAARCCDDSMSVRFHLLAGWVEQGADWRVAVAKVPRLMPPSITELLLLTDRIGGWDKIFPICQRKLADVLSQLRARQSCLSPSIIILPLPILYISIVLTVIIIPKFHAIAADYEVSLFSMWDRFEGVPLPAIVLLAGLALLPLFILLMHIGGPRLWSWLPQTRVPPGDLLAWLVPWERQRLQRDFAAVLGLMLDAGVAEREAVELAARGTANAILKKKAAAMMAALAAGQPLTEALSLMDPRGELKWRFQQAAEGGTLFETALAGWCDALQARADQLQQTGMQILSVGLLLINALFVGLIVFDLFRVLIQITEQALE